MKIILENASSWFFNANFEFMESINNLPGFMVGNILELLGILLASVIVAILSTLFVDKRRVIQKVKARVLDMRLEQYEEIRALVEEHSKMTVSPENSEMIKSNFMICDLSLTGNENCYSSREIATEERITQALFKLENLTMNGLYILDDDVLGMLLQIKIYIKNLVVFSVILRGYYVKIEKEREKIVTAEDINQILDLYFNDLSILLNNEYQNMIKKLQNMVIGKAAKPKFERKEKNYRKFKTRQRFQIKALNKTILVKKIPQLLDALALLNSAYLQESEEQRDKTIKELRNYAYDILRWQ